MIITATFTGTNSLGYENEKNKSSKRWIRKNF
jgi:hypothetical protein